jgi:hypothetical protein
MYHNYKDILVDIRKWNLPTFYFAWSHRELLKSLALWFLLTRNQSRFVLQIYFFVSLFQKVVHLIKSLVFHIHIQGDWNGAGAHTNYR